MRAVFAAQAHQGAIGIEQQLVVAGLALLQRLQVAFHILACQTQQRQDAPPIGIGRPLCGGGWFCASGAVLPVRDLQQQRAMLLQHLAHGVDQLGRTRQLHTAQSLPNLCQYLLCLAQVGVGSGGSRRCTSCSMASTEGNTNWRGSKAGGKVGHGAKQSVQKPAESA